MTTALTELGKGLDRAWERLGAGWRTLVRTTQNALTRYTPVEAQSVDARAERSWPAPGWGLLPGQVMETSKSIVVQIELPGVDRDDIDVEICDRELRVRGEKRLDRSYQAESYYLRQRAFGRFERVVALPSDVDPGSARASYRSGILTVEVRKTGARSLRRITVQ